MATTESIWYHGTNESSALNICNVGIDFSKSKKELDFGIGFYLTDDPVIAKRRAISQTQKYNRIFRKKDRPAIVTIIIDETLFEYLTIKNFEYCDKEWLDFVLANRLPITFLLEHNITEHNLDFRYDIVIGSIADSDVSSLSSYIEAGHLTFNDITVYDVLTKEGTTFGLQMSLHTMNSLQTIKFKSYEILEGRNK